MGLVARRRETILMNQSIEICLELNPCESSLICLTGKLPATTNRKYFEFRCLAPQGHGWADLSQGLSLDESFTDLIGNGYRHAYFAVI